MAITVYDASTGDGVSLPEDQAAKALADGSYFIPKGEKVPMVHENGSTVQIDAASVKDALNSGLFSLQTSTSIAAQKAVAEDAKSGVAGDIAAGARSFGNEALLGVPSIIADHVQTPEAVAARHAVSEAHPVSNIVGGGLGMLATLPLAEVSGLGKAATLAGEAAERGVLSLGERAAVRAATEEGVTRAAEAVAGKTIAGTAAKMAAEAAVYSSPQAVTEAAVGDPDQAAETLLMGIGTGAFLGVLGGGIRTAATAAHSALVDATPAISEALDHEANKMGFRAAGFQKSQIRRLGEVRVGDVEDQLFEHVITEPGMSKEAIAAKIAQVKQDAGEGIGEFVEKFDNVIREKPELLEKGFNPTTVLEEMKKLAEPIDNPMHQGEINYLRKMGQTIQEYGPNPIGFADSQELKSQFNAFKFKAFNATPKEQLENAVWGIIKREQENAAERVASESGNTKLLAEWVENKNKYRLSKDLEKGSENNFAAQYGNNSLFSMHNIVGMNTGAHLGASAGAAIAGPIGAAIGGPIGSAAMVVINHWLTDKGLGTGAYWLKKFANDPSSLPFLGNLIAKDGMDRLAAKIDEIPKLISSMPAIAAAKTKSNVDGIRMLLGGHANGLSKQQQFDKLHTALATAVATGNNNDHATAINSVFAHSSPTIAGALSVASSNAIQYLCAAAPRDTSPPKPFQTSNWKPSDKELRDYASKCAVVVNPFIVWDKLRAGTLTAGEVEALTSVYPKIAQGFRDKVQEAASDPKVKVPYAHRVKLAQLTGLPIEPTLALTQRNQTSYQSKSEQPQGRGPKLKMPDMSTPVQKRENK